MTKGTKIAIALALAIPLVLVGGALVVTADQIPAFRCGYGNSQSAGPLATAGDGDSNQQSVLCDRIAPDVERPLGCGLGQNGRRAGHQCECSIVDDEVVTSQVWGRCGSTGVDSIDNEPTSRVS